MVLLNDFLAVGNQDDKCVTGMHLIESVHHDWVSIVVEDEHEDNGGALFIAVALDQSNRAMLHFTRA